MLPAFGGAVMGLPPGSLPSEPSPLLSLRDRIIMSAIVHAAARGS